MVAQFGPLEDKSVCYKMHKVSAGQMVCDANAMPGEANCLHHEYNMSSRGTSFMRCLVVAQDEGLAVFCDINQQTAGYESNRRNSTLYIPSSRVHCDSLFFPPKPPFCCRPVLNTPPASGTISTSRDLHKTTPLVPKHPTTYTTLDFHSEPPCATFNCIIMLMPRMSIHFQLAAMAPNGSCKGEGKGTGRAKMPTSGTNRHVSSDRDSMNGFLLDHIRGLIWIYNVGGVKDERAWDHLYEIILIDPVTICHFSRFKLMWPHHSRRSSPFWDWWAAFLSYIGQMFDQTRD